MADFQITPEIAHSIERLEPSLNREEYHRLIETLDTVLRDPLIGTAWRLGDRLLYRYEHHRFMVFYDVSTREPAVTLLHIAVAEDTDKSHRDEVAAEPDSQKQGNTLSLYFDLDNFSTEDIAGIIHLIEQAFGNHLSIIRTRPFPPDSEVQSKMRVPVKKAA